MRSVSPDHVGSDPAHWDPPTWNARTYQRLRDGYRFERRGLVAVKGKGEMVTYFLVGRAR